MWRARNVSTSLVAISVFLLTLCCSGRADCQDVPKTADCPPGQHSELGGYSGPGGSCFPNVGRDPGSIPSTLEQSICYSDADCKPHFKCSYTGYDPDQKDNYGICICGQDCNSPPTRRGNSGS